MLANRVKVVGLTSQWMQEQQGLHPPVPYFMLTFTIPAPLCEIAPSNQNLL